jgi:hypothetical protein
MVMMVNDMAVVVMDGMVVMMVMGPRQGRTCLDHGYGCADCEGREQQEHFLHGVFSFHGCGLILRSIALQFRSVRET